MKSTLRTVVCDHCHMVFPLVPGEDYIKRYHHAPCSVCGKGEILSDKDLKALRSMDRLVKLGTMLEWFYYLTHPWSLFRKPEKGILCVRYDSPTKTWKVKDETT